MTASTKTYLTPAEFAAKIDSEGGEYEALDYGLKYIDLDPDDPASADLRRAWQDLETQWAYFKPALKRAAAVVDDIYADGEDTDDDD